MSKQHINFKNYRIPLMSSILGVGGALLFSYLTFVPAQTFAADIVDPTEMRTLSSIEYMQNMTQQICINSREHETKQLEDSRDHKKYWVTKLKDGNCWMAQNLDFDVPASLSSSDSDVIGTVTTDTVKVDDFTKWTDMQPTFNGYYDPGTLYYNGPDGSHKNGTICGVGNTSDDGITNSKAEGKTDMESFLDSCKEFSSTGTDTHYHVGNYYSWSAATVKSGDELGTDSSKTASMSICPSGWQLPTAGEKFGLDVNGSFAHLLKQYNMASDWNAGSINSTSAINGTTYHIYSEPLYFVYGGGIHSLGLGAAGSGGYYWSSTPIPTTDRAHSLDFNTWVYPSYSDARYAGWSLRCLSMGGWLDSYPDPNSEANVAITVAPVISIDVTSDAIVEEMDFTTVARTTIEARVGTNQGYKVLISAEEDATDLKSTKQDNTQVIPMISTDSAILPRTRAWGIKKLGIVSTSTGNSNNNDELITIPTSDGEGTGISVEVNKDTIYSPVGTPNSPETFYVSDTAAATTLIFPVAIAVDSTTPFGTYSTQVTLTAMVN